MIWGRESVSSSGVLVSQTQAQALANACAELALEKLKLDLAYVGNETLSVGTSSCQVISVTGTGNTNRVINAQATINSITRKVKVTISTVNQLTVISSWQEVGTLP